jgi:hypothetical protein
VTAARLFARRWPLYASTALAVFALQATFFLFSGVKHPEVFAELIGSPLIIVVVTVFIGADATNTLTTAQRWERILERAWAIVAIDVGLAFLTDSGVQTLAQGNADPANILNGVLALLLGAMLVYAEPFAALETEVQALTLVPFALLRSMMLAWVNIPRILALLAIQIAIDVVLVAIEEWLGLGLRATMWTMALQTFIAPPLAALFAVAYLDTLSLERKTTASP